MQSTQNDRTFSSKGRDSFFSLLLNRFGTPENVIENLVRQSSIQPLDARLDLQVFLNVMGREEESFVVSQQLLEIAPDDLRVTFNHGWHWLKRGELLKGMSLLEHGRPIRNYGNDPLPSSRPLWNAQTGRNQRVIFALEGGFGDEMINFRFGRHLVERYNCKVTVVCSPGLANIVARQPWVSAVAQREAAPGIYHDSWLPAMSSCVALGYDYKDIRGEPYLSADHELTRQWSTLINASASGRLKVGIRWAGRPQFEHQQLRLFPADILTDLHTDPRVRLYSFQRDDNLVDLPSDVVDLGPHLKNWDDTAAAIENMDLVISSCTSVAHLSAAMGKPTWVLVPALPYFCWALPGRRSPWYDSVKLFRQSHFTDWNDVRTQLQSEFSHYLDSGKTLGDA